MADHDHDHSHSDGHAHAPKDFGMAFAVGTILNLGFVIVEVVFGFLSNSVALVADAGHNLGDVLGLVMAWVATILARRAPSAKHTYGLRRGTILAALANGVLLLITTGAIFVEGVRRVLEPGAVEGVTVMMVAGVGIAINGVTAWSFAAGRKGDINVRAAFMHMLGDALIAGGVVVAGGIILLTGWNWVDPVVSIGIAGIVVVATWGLLRDSVGMSLDAVPPGIALDAVSDFLKQQPGVTGLHDLHIWPMSTTETALTCHLVIPGGHPGDGFLSALASDLRTRFQIGHATVQVESSADAGCVLEPDHIV